MKTRLLALAFLALCLPAMSSAQAATPGALALTPQHLMDRATVTGRAHVIVQLGGAASAPEVRLQNAAAIAGQRARIKQAQADVRTALRGLAHQVRREYASLPYVALEVGPDALRMLDGMRGLVTRIDEDVTLQRMLGESGPLVQAPAAWAAGADGQGTVIAVIDDGADSSHVFLSGKVVGEACFVLGGECPNGLDSQVGPGAALPCFDCYHGTHVTGIAAGNGGPPANVGFSGVAKGASVVAIRVFSAFGGATLSDVLAGLEHVYLLRDTHNFAAVNMSLGIPGFPQFGTCDDFEPATTMVIENLRAAGIATTISSGNDGFTSAISFPACISGAISVASSDDGSEFAGFPTIANQVSFFSNVAPFVSLIAPGFWITSSFPGDVFDTIGGTSMAAPHVAGAFAILKQARPTATVADLLAVLQTTGAPTADDPSIDRPFAEGTVMSQIRVADALANPDAVRFSSAAFSVSESGAATITVTRSGENTGTTTVNYATSNGTALAGTHYTSANGTLTFNPGDTVATFTVTPIDNVVVNPSRTVNLTLSGVSDGFLGSPSTAVLTITNDDDGGTIAFNATAFQVAENGGTVTVEVIRTGTNLAGGVTVHYATANGTAIAGTAYTATSGTLSFAAGVTSLTFTVPILDNSLLQGDKTFEVRLSDAAGGGTLGTPATATVTIVEDETPGTFQFSSATYSVTEGMASATITVTRTGTNLAGGVRIGYATSNGTATAGIDYTATSGTLLFGAGVTSMTFTVAIREDALFEPAETVDLALSVPVGSPAVLGTPATAVLTIEDNDAPTLQFSVASQSVAEGATASVVVTRVGGLNAAVAVDYGVVGGTATGGGVDFTLSNGTLSFAVSQVSATIMVPTVNDTLFEGPETIVLQLTNPSGGARLGLRTSTTLTIVDGDNPGTIQFSAAAYSVAENVASGVFNLVVTRTGSNLASGITVDYAVTGGTATGGGVDYTLDNGTITFGAGQTSALIQMLINNDGEPEGNETVIVTLSNPGAVTGTGLRRAALGPVSVTTLTILDDEQAVGFSATAYSVTEGTATIAIPIVRSGPITAATTITCQTSGGTALVDFDYRAVNTTLTFAAGSRMVNCVVPILNDTIVDGARTVNLALSVPPGSIAVLGTQATALLTINDNDQGGTIRFSAATFSVAEGATASLTVMRSGVNLASGVTVDYAVTGGTAANGVDYTLDAGTLTFGAGQMSRTILVPTTNDTLAEGPETVVVTLSNPSIGAALGAPASTTLTIVDNDNPGTIQFSAAAYSVAENVASGVFNLVVTRTGVNLASGITVDYAATGGTATNGDDYTLASGTLTFAAGQTSALIPVTIHDDGDPEGNETVIVTLSNPGAITSAGLRRAALGAVSVTTLTILDDEQAVSFSAPTYSVTEGTATLAIPILRSGPTTAGTTITCTASGGSAVADFDYRPVDTTLTFAAGSRMVNCVVPILNDTIVDGARTVNLALTVPTGSTALLGNHATAVLTINDNDQGGTIRFSAATFTVAEGATATLTVMRTGVNLASGVTVDYTVTGGNGANGVDYTLDAGTLTFGAGQTSRTIPVPTTNDTLAEGPETVVVTLSNPTGGAALGAPAFTTLTIVDNDNPGTIQFSAAGFSVAENVAGGSFNLVVTRTGVNLASNITVDYAVTGGTATGGGVDYTLANGTLTFAAGQTSALIQVLIHDDGEAEGNETVIVALSNPTALTAAGLRPAALGTVSVATLTILDDEQAVSFSAPAYSVTEGTATMTIPILRSGPTPAGTTVTCQTVGGSAVPNFDYRPVNITLTFAAGSRMVNCVVPILNDTVIDGPQTVNLELTVPPGSSALLGAPKTAVLTINDNDQGGTIRFSATTFSVGEGGTGSLTVTRSGVNLASGVTVDYAVTGGTAASGADYILAAGTLVFNAGQTSAVIQVPTFPDAVFDGNETVIVTLSNPTSGATLGLPSSTTLTIGDRTRPARVRFLNDLQICVPGCQDFTARLTAEERYVWASTTGAASPYQNVVSATLSNFTLEAVGFAGSLFFPGSFTITPNRLYIIVFTLDPDPILFLFDEGSVAANSSASEAARSLVGSITSKAIPAMRFPPLSSATASPPATSP